MRPRDLTGLALANPAVGAVLLVTWLLVFVPTARMIVRPPAAYLYSLPGDPLAARAVAAAALLLLQLPWVILWIAGEGARGALVVLATTAVAAGLAGLPPPHPLCRPPALPLALVSADRQRSPLALVFAARSHARAPRGRPGDRGHARRGLLRGWASGPRPPNNHRRLCEPR
jgi:hypothetical protein